MSQFLCAILEAVSIASATTRDAVVVMTGLAVGDTCCCCRMSSTQPVLPLASRLHVVADGMLPVGAAVAEVITRRLLRTECGHDLVTQVYAVSMLYTGLDSIYWQHFRLFIL